MNLNKIQRVHFIGIGGIGMSALARHFLHGGKTVSGSDRSLSSITDALEAEGMTFFALQIAENVSDDIDLVIYTEAMSKDHEELVAAREKGICCINYFEGLGLVANPYYLIAVAGSHGKTTTTAMLADIFEDAELDPSVVVGSLRSRTQKNYRAGKSKYFIAEACEYRRDFLHLEPDVLVITNIEAEHLDYYKDLDDVIAAFHELARKVPEDGAIICNTKDPAVIKAISGIKAKVIDYTVNLDLLAPMKQPGLHNRLNAAAARAVGEFLKLPSDSVEKSISDYAGAWRRFEYKGKTKEGAHIYDDYGHHPSEIKATLQGARELYLDKKILLVYQPHMYSRTHELFEDFVSALSGADEVILLPIYAAREENLPGVSSKMLSEKVEVPAIVAETFEKAVTRIHEVAGENHIVLVMGAGDVYKVADMLSTH